MPVKPLPFSQSEYGLSPFENLSISDGIHDSHNHIQGHGLRDLSPSLSGNNSVPSAWNSTTPQNYSSSQPAQGWRHNSADGLSSSSMLGQGLMGPPGVLQHHSYPSRDFINQGLNNVSAYQPPSPPERRGPGPIARPISTAYLTSQDGMNSQISVESAPQARRSSGRDEFDGPHQFLPRPSNAHIEVVEDQLIDLKVSLDAREQDEILVRVNDRLSQCAFDFVAKYQFPIPVEMDKRPVRVPGDREWTEWCHLLKRLATKRRIPKRVLWHEQIKQLVTVLENSLEMRHAAMHTSRILKDDRNILQLISAGLQVTKMLKDPGAMRDLDSLYMAAERKIHERSAQTTAG